MFPEILAAHDLLALRPAGQLVWHLLVALAEGAAVLLALIKGNRILARGLLEVKHEEEKSSESEENVDASTPILSCRCQFVAVNRKALDEHLVSVWNFEFTTANITRKKAIQDAHPRRDGDTFEAWKARMEKV